MPINRNVGVWATLFLGNHQENKKRKGKKNLQLFISRMLLKT